MSDPCIRHRLLYDRDDCRLLEIVNKILSRGQNPSLLRKLFDPGLHPRGIKELAAPKSLRIASAMIDLLGTLEQGSASERIAALRAARSESLHESSQSLRLNLARVLLQIMKEMIRSVDDEEKQLQLAHDFREVSSGKARLIRKQLRKYHLLEMPESWNQLAFDHHVHDANTKGRKSPTHLIMDAWIKGIRFLGVIYYNYVKPEVAAELLEAADIMGIEVRIGIEVSARLRNKFVQLIWAPRGFLGRHDFLRFLEEPEVKEFLAQGQEVVEYEKSRVLQLLATFNEKHLPALNEKYGVSVPPLDEEEFLVSVGCGQVSLVHLAEFAHRSILPHLQTKTKELSREYESANGEDRARIKKLVDSFNQLDPETLLDRYLSHGANMDLVHDSAEDESDRLPTMLSLDTSALLDKLDKLPCRSRITLNPSNLSPADVLEVLYDGRGRITHLEIYNLKDWAQERIDHRPLINYMRLVINSGNVVEAKRLVGEIMESVELEVKDGGETWKKIREIFRDVKTLLGFYRASRLRSRLGSDSIGQSRYTRGMGLVVVPTLPWRARMEIRHDPERLIPVTTVALRHTTEIKNIEDMPLRQLPPERHEASDLLVRGPRSKKVTWSVGHNTTTLADHGNIATLGGLPEQDGNGLHLASDDHGGAVKRPSFGPMNSGLINSAKILMGFLPAFLTFYLTKDWWLLAYFGAPIWFGITGFRNILQSVVGGGGLRRSSLLHWKDLVSWGRVADSLLFTGFSVPLLDYLVKKLLLAHALGITTSTDPIMLYTVIAIANGIYISSHNTYRGLPLGAIVGNFFRTILSIPLAIGLNYAIEKIVIASGVPVDAALAGMQLWAAVISKAASDVVAAIIEGAADRHQNFSHRKIDYEEKLAQIYDVFAQLETTFPEQDVLALSRNSKKLFEILQEKNVSLFRNMVIDSLDLLYFWMYQPRARATLAQQIKSMSSDEREFFLQSQKVLELKRVVSEMFLDGLVGKRFEKALAFYLSYSDGYLRSLARIAKRS